MGWRLPVGLAGFAVASLAAMVPAAADFRVCNKSGETVDVAIGFFADDKSGWISRGWYRINAGGGCVPVWWGDLNNRYYYVYADTGGGAGHRWDGAGTNRPTAPFCVSKATFRLDQNLYGSRQDADCARHQLHSRTFFRVDVGNARQFDFTLDLPRGPSQPAPPSSPTPTPASPPPVTSGPPPSKPPPGKGSACERFPNLC